MAEMTAWIADCHLQDREAQTDDCETQDYTCQAAVWADGYDTFKARLNAFLETTPYKLLWLEECLEAVGYIKRHGQQQKVGGLARTVHIGHLVELGPLTAKGSAEDEPAEALSFKDALLALDYKTAPVFAVLDGAQFDNLPKALFDGDFISRPLYLDRGDNDPEQIITAPHMVTLDERSEKVTGRSYEDTIDALLTLIDNKPAAVFWQCSEGKDVLYKHLRKISKIMIPKGELPGGADEPGEETADETHAMVLFRYADANVLTQTLYAMTAPEAARFFGPATRLLFAPNPDWADGKEWLRADKSDDWPDPKPGVLRLCQETMDRIGGARFKRRQKRIMAYLRKVAPEQTKKINDEKLGKATAKYIKEAEGYGVKSEAALGRWCYLQVITLGKISQQKELTDYISEPNPSKSPDDRVRDLLHMAAYKASGG